MIVSTLLQTATSLDGPLDPKMLLARMHTLAGGLSEEDLELRLRRDRKSVV